MTQPAFSAAPSTTPVVVRERWRRVAPPVLLAGGLLAVSVALHFRDPHDSGSWGLCPWLVLTGTHCPGCGGLRAVNDLTHGDLAAAASSNLLLVASTPIAVVAWVRSVASRWLGRGPGLPTRAVVRFWIGFGVVALVFAVVRNTPYGAWLAP